jgi:hypothetical protein
VQTDCVYVVELHHRTGREIMAVRIRKLNKKTPGPTGGVCVCVLLYSKRGEDWKNAAAVMCVLSSGTNAHKFTGRSLCGVRGKLAWARRAVGSRVRQPDADRLAIRMREKQPLLRAPRVALRR